MDYPTEKINAENTVTLGQLFDREAEWLFEEHIRPHWSQDGAIVFVTIRTVDSIPKEVILRWEREKAEWLAARNFRGHWKEILPTLPHEEQELFQKTFNRHREMYLDTCHGACVLKRPELSEIVGDALMHFDGQRYRMGDFIVMPNHIHLLAAFTSAEQMLAQFDSWTHFSAVKINRMIGTKGKFWQHEPFDHLVRSVEQYEYLRRYIAQNPEKAKLSEEEYLYRRYPG